MSLNRKYAQRMDNIGGKMQEFWSLVVQVWQHGVYGVDIGSLALAMGVFVLFVLIRRLFTRFVVGALRRWTR